MPFDRREFLGGLAAVGAAVITPHIWVSAQDRNRSAAPPFRIDTHTHFSIPKLYDLAAARGVNQATLKDWTPQKMLQQMEEGCGGHLHHLDQRSRRAFRRQRGGACART